MVFNEGKPLYQAADGGKVPLEFSQDEKVQVQNAQSFLSCVKCIMLCNPCFCCLYTCVPEFRNNFRAPDNLGMVRGLPIGSQLLSEHEKSQILARWRGNWKVQPLSGSSGGERTDAFIDGDKVILTGGFYQRPGKRRGMAANKPMEQALYLYRAPNGDLYVDNIGTKLERESEGELYFDTAYDTKVLYQREWKRMGMAGPQGGPLAVPNEPATGPLFPPSAPPPTYGAPPPFEAPPPYEALPQQKKMSHC